MYAIFTKNLTEKYGNTEVLNKISLRMEEGEFYTLMGPNGSGKTTFTSIIASVKLPTSGEGEIFGKNPENAKEVIGYDPQENFSSPILTRKAS